MATPDLNVMRALSALLEHRSVTLAAQHVGISQPSMSAALARLRRHFQDDLLIRVGRQYQLTPLAQQLQERTRTAVSAVDRVFDSRPGFDPTVSRREFHLVVSDYALGVFGKRLAALLSTEAPHARLRLSMPTARWLERTEQFMLNTDLLILPHGFVSDLSHEDLYRDEWLCIVSADNTALGSQLSVDQLQTLPWAVCHDAPIASTPAVRSMRMQGIEPPIQVVTESFLMLPDLVAGSPRVALLQRRLIEALPPHAGIRVLPCPFDASPLVQAMWWHPVFDADPEHMYLRSVVRRATEALRSNTIT